MNTFAEVIIYQEYPFVTYYSVVTEEHDLSLADHFFTRERHLNGHRESLGQIASWLKRIGRRRRGATPDFFRPVENFHELPPPNTRLKEIGEETLSLRLFCMRISNQIVILFNGGVKTSQTTQDSPDLYPAKFRQAQHLTHVIDDKIKGRYPEWKTDDKRLFPPDYHKLIL